jgi:hypothetical protein
MNKAFLALCAFVVMFFSAVFAGGSPPRPQRNNQLPPVIRITRQNLGAARARARALAQAAAANLLSPIDEADADSDEAEALVPNPPLLRPLRVSLSPLFVPAKCAVCKMDCALDGSDSADEQQGLCHAIHRTCLREVILDLGLAVDEHKMLLYGCPECALTGRTGFAKISILHVIAVGDIEIIENFFIAFYGSVAAGINDDLTNGKTLVHLAAQFNNEQVLKWALENGANQHIPDNQGVCPVQHAVTHVITSRLNDYVALKLLLNNGGWGPAMARQIERLNDYFSHYHDAYRSFAYSIWGIPENAQLPGKK